jgi:hypothetical protein
MNAIWASADSANLLISGFRNRFNRITDSFITRSAGYRQSLYWHRTAYILDTDKTEHITDINNTVDSIKMLADSSLSGIIALSNEISNKGIVSPGFLALDAFRMNHDYLPGSPGSFTYTFTNYGGKVLSNVSFKVSGLQGGFALTSPDSLQVGNVAPGQTVQVTYQFSSPNLDTMGRYNLLVKSGSTALPSLTGTLFTNRPGTEDLITSAKNGNWNDAATWDKGAIPDSSKRVLIKHEVRITADAQCKSLETQTGGKVLVDPDKKLDIKEN